MRVSRATWIALAVLVAVAAPVQAQQAEDVLTRIPGESLAFLAVPGVGEAGTNVGRFVNDVMMQQMPGSLLDMLKAQMRIGPGFNDLGGFAAVLLDPAMLGLPTTSLLDESTWTEAPPVAFLLPGNDPAMLFSMYDPQIEEDGFIRIQFRGKTAYTKPLGDYTVMAADKPIVDAVARASTSAAQVLSDDHRALFKANDVVVYINVKRGAPLIVAAIEKLIAFMNQMAQSPMMDPAAGGVFQMYAKMMPMITEIIGEMDAATVALRFGPHALRFDSLVTFAPGSSIGKALAAWAPVPDPLLDRLPNLPYVVAAGHACSPEAAAELAAAYRKYAAKLFDAFVTADTDAALTPEQTKRWLDMIVSWYRQMTGMQMYMGPPPAGSGLLAFGFVMKMRDANAGLDMMPEMVELNEAFTEALMSAMPGAPTYTMDYRQNAANVEGVSVDVMVSKTIYPPGSEMVAQMARQMTQTFYGEEDVTIRMGAVGADRLVMSFGGGEAFLAEMIKAARTGGPLEKDLNTAAGIALLPRKPQLVALCSAPNLLEFVKKVVKAVLPPDVQPMVSGPVDALQIRVATPITYGMSAKGSGMYQALAIPTPLISDIYQNVMMLMMQMQMQPGGPGQPAAPTGSF